MWGTDWWWPHHFGHLGYLMDRWTQPLLVTSVQLGSFLVSDGASFGAQRTLEEETTVQSSAAAGRNSSRSASSAPSAVTAYHRIDRSLEKKSCNLHIAFALFLSTNNAQIMAFQQSHFFIFILGLSAMFRRRSVDYKDACADFVNIKMLCLLSILQVLIVIGCACVHWLGWVYVCVCRHLHLYCVKK